jgi:hypothetical protein
VKLKMAAILVAGSLATVVAIDLATFVVVASGGWGYRDRPRTFVDDETARWWTRNVAELPGPTRSSQIVLPAPAPPWGPTGNGLAGFNANLSPGLVAYDVIGPHPALDGEVLLSPNHHVWRLRAVLTPLGAAFDHVVIRPPSQDPPPPHAVLAWRLTPNWPSLAAWSLASSIPTLVGLLVAERVQRARRAARDRRGICGDCRFRLEPDVTVCPECGRARPTAVGGIRPDRRG